MTGLKYSRNGLLINNKGMTDILHITADKRLRYASPKLPLATSFIRRTLSEIGGVWLMKKIRKMWRPPLNTKR